MVRIFAFLALVLASLTAVSASRAEVLPRVVIVVTDGAPDSLAARLGVPALQRLGLVPEIYRADIGLPELDGRKDVAGVLIWLDEGRVADGAAFLAWVRRLTTLNLPLALMGTTPSIEDRFGLFVSLGVLYSVEDRSYTYDLTAIAKDQVLLEPRRRFGRVWPATDQIRPLEPPPSEAALTLQRGTDSTDRTMPLLFTPRVAYAAPGYAVWRSADGKQAAWMIDPAAWFTRAFRLGVRPAPDAGLINARRIFAPALAPADEAAAPRVLRAATGLGHAQPLDVMLDPPSGGQIAATCGQGARARFFGFDGLLGLNGDGAISPVVTMCSDDPETARAAVQAAYAYAASHPVLTAAISLTDVEMGFASAEIDALGQASWRIRNRGALQTLRFSAAGLTRVDWYASEGVIGAARVGDALVVSLDPDVAEPVVAISRDPWELPPFAVLVESRWLVSGLARDADNAAMHLQGYGRGDMVWQVEPRSEWEVRFKPESGATTRWRAVAGDDGLIAMSLPAQGANGAQLEFERQDYAGAGP